MTTPHDPMAADPHPRGRGPVLDSEISYVDVGQGDPVVFLHGNPTSAYLWRRIIPFLSGRRRCLAPDLVGMGQSGPSPGGRYRFADHARYLDGWFEALGLTGNIMLVLHDWGSALGLHYARRFPQRIQAIAYLEAIVQPRLWSDFPAKSILRRLSAAEMAAYRQPFREPAARAPTLAWARELPIEGETG